MVDWKQTLGGLVVGAIIGIAGTFFLFQGRVSTLETKIEQLSGNGIESSSASNAHDPDLDSLFRHAEWECEISEPGDGQTVGTITSVRGEFSGVLSPFHLWVVVHPVGTAGWWPQYGEIVPEPSSGSWEAPVTLGVEGDKGKRFEISLVVVPEEENGKLNKYIDLGKRTGSYPEAPLPSPNRVLAKVTVIRN